MSFSSRLKALYHLLVPRRVRDPLGRARRGVEDRALRLFARPPLPPRDLLLRVQVTPWVMEYLEVGAHAARSLESALEEAGLPAGESSRVLDFGCGPGRTLRHLTRHDWSLAGCDVDADAVGWCRQAMAEVDAVVNGARPPLPFDAASFDAVYTVSVFTHFDAEEQKAWAEEMARVVRPGGLLAVSTMGSAALAALPRAFIAHQGELERDGYFFFRDGETFSLKAAFHSEAGLARLFAPSFEVAAWAERGLDGFQDLAVLRRSWS